MKKKVGATLAEARKAQQLSQTDMAHILGISMPNVIVCIEAGKRCSHISFANQLDCLVRYAQLLGVPESDVDAVKAAIFASEMRKPEDLDEPVDIELDGGYRVTTENLAEYCEIEDAVAAREFDEALAEILRSIPAREALAVRMFILGGERQIEIAKRLGLSRERVRTILKTAFKRIRHPSSMRKLFSGSNYYEAARRVKGPPEH